MEYQVPESIGQFWIVHGDGNHRIHTEWQRPLSGLHHDGKINPGWCRGGGAVRPPTFTLFTITYKVAVYAPAERTDTLPLFLLYPYELCGGNHKLKRTEVWNWPLSCINSVMMVFLAQLAEGEGVANPLSHYLPPPLELRRPLHPPPSKTSEI